MINRIVVLLILSFVSFYSCKETTNNTYVFNEYLEKVLHYKIPDEEAIFVVIPKLGCGGCMEQIVGVIRESQQIHNDRVNLIIANNKFQYGWKETKVFMDSLCIIEEYNLPISGITIIETKARKVEVIVNLVGEDSAKEYFKQY